MEEILIIALFSLLVGIISLVIAIRLLSHFKKIREKATLALASYVLFYAIGCFLWTIEDAFLRGNLPVATSAYIFQRLPAYLGVLFVVFILKVRLKLIISISSAIIGASVLSFIIFPLEMEAFGGGFAYHPAPFTNWILLFVVAMAFLPVGLLLAYGLKMSKLGKVKERNKGLVLAFGFLLVMLGDYILFPYFRIPLLMGWIIILVGFFFLYFGFTRLRA
jgi:hypothetical protein